MSVAASVQTQAAKSLSVNHSKRAGLVLQRKCACGGSAGLTGECDDCRNDKLLGANGARLQRKLAIGASNDPLELEADRIADQILAAPANAAVRDAPLQIQRYAGQPSTSTGTTPAIVERVLASSGRPLEPALRQNMEQRFGHDFSRVQVHSGAVAEQSAREVNANAYTVGNNIVFGMGRFAPGTHEGRRLIAHELTHVVQQVGSDGIRVGQGDEKHGLPPISTQRFHYRILPQRKNALQRQSDDAPQDAGVPLPAGVIDTYAPRRPIEGLSDQDLGLEYPDAEQLALSGNPERLDAIEDEIERRQEQGFGTAVPRGTKPSTPANTGVTPDVALKILDNVSKGEPPFRPELGKGGSSWFVTEGSPYVGIDPAKNINIEVEILKTKDVVLFGENELTEILEQESKSTAAEAEAKFRENFGFDKNASLSNRVMKSLTRFQKRFAESRMWDRVGEQVRVSTGKVGEVVLKEGSKFSKTPGKFAVVADRAKVQVKGGISKLMESLSKQGVGAEPVIVEAAEAMAKKMKWAGRVRGVFHYGGRVLIVVAIAADVYKIFHANNKIKAVIESAGGWAGATAAGAAFAAWFAPADVAGPWAWAAHGVGTLVAGGIGYWVGSEVTRTIYELVLED